MKHEVITEPKHFGCACCATPSKRLDKETQLDTGFGDVVLKIYLEHTPEYIEIHYRGGVDWENFPTVADWEKKYEALINVGDTVTIAFNTPLHDETYELNKEDGEWYLIKQGPGFA